MFHLLGTLILPKYESLSSLIFGLVHIDGYEKCRVSKTILVVAGPSRGRVKGQGQVKVKGLCEHIRTSEILGPMD